MSKISAKISSKYRYFFYLILCFSVISGSAFWLLKTFAIVEGDFGPESHFLQYPMLQFHGFAAFTMLLCLGAIFGSHVPKNWHYQRGKQSGSVILAFVVFSILSAYSLYYLVSEEWHILLANSHAIVGLSLPIILYLHLKLARKSKSKKHRRLDKIKQKTVRKKTLKSDASTLPTNKQPSSLRVNIQQASQVK
jgi:hypothetical protein